jgi:hypothetical protein
MQIQILSGSSVFAPQSDRFQSVRTPPTQGEARCGSPTFRHFPFTTAFMT